MRQFASDAARSEVKAIRSVKNDVTIPSNALDSLEKYIDVMRRTPDCEGRPTATARKAAPARLKRVLLQCGKDCNIPAPIVGVERKLFSTGYERTIAHDELLRSWVNALSEERDGPHIVRVNALERERRVVYIELKENYGPRPDCLVSLELVHAQIADGRLKITVRGVGAPARLREGTAGVIGVEILVFVELEDVIIRTRRQLDGACLA